MIVNPALTVGSFFPTIYYGFYCFPSLQRFYLGGITTSGLGESSRHRLSEFDRSD